MRAIIVTGANGYIGQHCLSSLKKYSTEIHAFSRGVPKTSSSNIHWHKLDLLEESAAELFSKIKPSHLLHLAWCTEHGRYWDSPLNSDWLASSIQLVKDFRAAGGERVVSAGSCAEYLWGGICEEGVTSEEPATYYGQCKKNFSDFLKEYSIETGLRSASGRVFFLYGPKEGEKRLVPSVIRALLRGDDALCTDGEQQRDFMYVTDVADALVELLKSNAQGVVNIASGQSVYIGKVIEEIGTLLGKSENIKLGVRPRGAGEPDCLVAVTKRLNHEIGFLPKINLTEGLIESIRAIRSI